MSEPVTLAEARAFLRVTSTQEDALITSLIEAAREVVEHETGRRLIPTTMVMRLDRFPPDRTWLELPGAPAALVTSVAYVDPDGASQTFAGASYALNTAQEPGRIHLDPDVDWPSTDESSGCVTVTYVAGYATADAVPERVKLLVLWLVEHYFNQRAHVAFASVAELPNHLRSLLTAATVYTIHGAEITSLAATPIP